MTRAAAQTARLPVLDHGSINRIHVSFDQNSEITHGHLIVLTRILCGFDVTTHRK